MKDEKKEGAEKKKVRDGRVRIDHHQHHFLSHAGIIQPATVTLAPLHLTNITLAPVLPKHVGGTKKQRRG